MNKIQILRVLIDFIWITLYKPISYFWGNEQREVNKNKLTKFTFIQKKKNNRRKWTRLKYLELFKILLFTSQYCSLKKSKQKKVNKIQILLNYIKEIIFVFSSEWTEKSEQKKVNKIQTLRTFQNSILFTFLCSLPLFTHSKPRNWLV